MLPVHAVELASAVWSFGRRRVPRGLIRVLSAVRHGKGSVDEDACRPGAEPRTKSSRDEVGNEFIVKGYAIDKDTLIEVTKEEHENGALESTRTVEIDEFVERSEIDPRYLMSPYCLRPDGKVDHDAFAVIREIIREMDKVAIGRVVLTNREHIIALEPLENELVGTLLRYPYEVRSEQVKLRRPLRA
jgi:Ku protein